jgi:hypothetical protein
LPEPANQGSVTFVPSHPMMTLYCAVTRESMHTARATIDGWSTAGHYCWAGAPQAARVCQPARYCSISQRIYLPC